MRYVKALTFLLLWNNLTHAKAMLCQKKLYYLWFEVILSLIQPYFSRAAFTIVFDDKYGHCCCLEKLFLT